MPRRSAVTPELVALLPMRAGSERVPRKNVQPLAGRPLFHHALDALLACEHVAAVVIDTDCDEVMASVERDFAAARARIELLERPPRLSAGTVPMNDVILHDVQQVEAPLYLQTHATSPLLTPATLDAAIERFAAAGDAHDSLFSVTRRHTRLWDAQGNPLNHDPRELLRTQDLPPVYEENSGIYLFSRALILETGNRIGARPLLFEVDPVEAWDIDDASDLEIAEALHRARHAERTP
jgi:CMP-N-acetylneuraminic acid synthetase